MIATASVVTHTFLSEDLQSLLPLARDYLTSDEPELWVLCSDSGAVMGFIGMSGSKMGSLFLAPEFHRRGGGCRLVRHARELHGELTTGVNEQNPSARAGRAQAGKRWKSVQSRS